VTAFYDKHGIQFRYPENWKLVHEQTIELPFDVSIQTPGGGFWSVHVYDDSTDPETLASEALRTMRQEYDEVESETIREHIGDTEAVGYEMNFYCLDLICTARALAFRSTQQTVLVLYQAESREFDEIGKVFQAMTLSLQRPEA